MLSLLRLMEGLGAHELMSQLSRTGTAAKYVFILSLQIPTAIESKLCGLCVLFSHNSETKSCQKVCRFCIMHIQLRGVGGMGWDIKVLVMSEHSVLVCEWVGTICSTLGTVGTYIGGCMYW